MPVSVARVSVMRAFCWAAPGHAALSTDTARRRRSPDSGYRCSCQSVWTLRVSLDHGAAGACRLEGGKGPGRTHLASRRAEGTEEAEAERPPVAQRWLVCAVAADACEPRVELRLRECANARRP